VYEYGGAAAVPISTTHGFTGHEHVDTYGFIHMNGRVYDPTIGRMLQVDPSAPTPTNH
jgi:RHS repeat-associated protein